MMNYVAYIWFLIKLISFSSQNCQKEISEKGIQVIWHESPPGKEIVSEPLCYNNNRLVTRECNDTSWSPSLINLNACIKIGQHFNLSSCPPRFNTISGNGNKHCYQTSDPMPWNYPCLKSRGASLLTDLSETETVSLINSLKKSNISRYFWLPAQRPKLLNPLRWTLPGPNWGKTVIRDFKNLRSNLLWFKNCLMLDIEQMLVATEVCDKTYPSICFYVNDLHYPAKCPDGYYGSRFIPNDGMCFGIEYADNGTLTFDEFRNSKCRNPLGSRREYNEITRFLFTIVADMNNLSEDTWCWFQTSYGYDESDESLKSLLNEIDATLTDSEPLVLQGIINNNGTLGLRNKRAGLPCMACEREMIYGETSLTLEYNEFTTKLYLTIYFPSGLWKYDNDDKGVQCFSDAKGFVKVIDINDDPFLETDFFSLYDEVNETAVEKVVYIIDLVTERSAQYWCEGHTNQLELLTTNIIVVNPKNNQLHVFALVVKTSSFYIEMEEPNAINNLTSQIATILNAEKVLLMEVLEWSMNQMLVLLHVHVTVSANNENNGDDIQSTFNILKDKAKSSLQNHNITFVNISSSLYCMPTTSLDTTTVLQWELTPIGHIAAPKQFCLQRNGLPVKRQCLGSYHLGGFWGKVDGKCDTKFEPSSTTTFLYNFMKGQVSDNETLRFLTQGLNNVLGDVNAIIPADIYYLAMSLEHFTRIVQENETSVEMGDIDNMVWVMDRIQALDDAYLRLAQILNSSNIILDKINDIIEILAVKISKDYYRLAVEPQFVVQITYPEVTNISGLAIIRQNGLNKFNEMQIIPLYKNTSLESLLAIENLELATWVPDNVLETLSLSSNDTVFNESYINFVEKDIHIIISVFHNDAVFQELDNSTYLVNSRVIGISIPGFISNLKYPIPLVFKAINSSNVGNMCGYWDFRKKTQGGSPGFWTNRDCFYVISVGDLIVCECFHMTNFGQLIDIRYNINNKYDRPDSHTKTLNLITLIGSFLSLLGIAGIFVTAVVFRTWRKKPGTKILLQLSTAVALPLVCIVVFNLDNTIFSIVDGYVTMSDDMRLVCIILGAFLHYSILASFMWMLITAILQFIRYVRVLGVCRPSRFMIKFTIVGWGVPLVPVLFVLLSESDNYIPSMPMNSPDRPICYPRVIYSISRGPDGKMRATDKDLVGAQLRLSIFLFFLLGLTWIFGIFSFTRNILWSYFFCFTSTLQGFVLFIYFVICDPATRNLWVTLMKPQFRATAPRESITSMSSS